MLPRPVSIPVIVQSRTTDPAIAQRAVACVKRPGEVLIIAGLVLSFLIGVAATAPTAPPTSD